MTAIVHEIPQAEQYGHSPDEWCVCIPAKIIRVTIEDGMQPNVVHVYRHRDSNEIELMIRQGFQP